MSALKVAHDIPGRLRLRLPVGAPTEGLEATVAAAPGVTGSTWSPRTRSLLVLYDPRHGDRDAIVDAAARVTGLEPPPEGAAHGVGTALVRPAPGATFGLAVREMFGEIDQRVQRASRGLVGLRGLFPVALTAWAATEVVRGRAAPLAWSSALWYAHGLFRDYEVPVTRS
jgi:hypothetical protein